MREFPKNGVGICRTVSQENESICLAAVPLYGGTDVMSPAVGIGKNKNFHR